jgi:hypothetical protein
VHLSDGRSLTCVIEPSGDDGVVVTADEVVLLRLRRTGPKTMRTDAELPLVRVD